MDIFTPLSAMAFIVPYLLFRFAIEQLLLQGCYSTQVPTYELHIFKKGIPSNMRSTRFIAGQVSTLPLNYQSFFKESM